MQREGRIIRQGNENDEVTIYSYVTEGSFDAMMWDLLRVKAQFISQMMNGDLDVRSVEDVGDMVMGYAHVASAAMGNTLIKDKMSTDKLVTKLNGLKSGFERKLRDAKIEKTEIPIAIEKTKFQIKKYEMDIAAKKDTKGDKFTAVIDGVTYTKREDADAALDTAIESAKQHLSIEQQEVYGQIGGLSLVLRKKARGWGNEVKEDIDLFLTGPSKEMYPVNTESMAGIENVLRNMNGMITYAEDRIGVMETQLKDLDRILEKTTFDQEAELKEVLQKQVEINRAISELNTSHSNDAKSDDKSAEQENTERLRSQQRSSNMGIVPSFLRDDQPVEKNDFVPEWWHGTTKTGFHKPSNSNVGFADVVFYAGSEKAAKAYAGKNGRVIGVKLKPGAKIADASNHPEYGDEWHVIPSDDWEKMIKIAGEMNYDLGKGQYDISIENPLTFEALIDSGGGGGSGYGAGNQLKTILQKVGYDGIAIMESVDGIKGDAKTAGRPIPDLSDVEEDGYIRSLVLFNPNAVLTKAESAMSAEQENTDRLRGQQRSQNLGIIPSFMRNDRPTSTPRMNKFESSDPEVEKRMKAAVYRPPGAWDKVKEWMETVKRQITREFQHLPNNHLYSKVRFELHRMQKAPAIAQDVVIREYLTGITRNLNKGNYELMMRIVVLRDLKRDMDRGIALKFGYTKEVLEEDLQTLEDIAKDNEFVTKALDLRNRLFKEKTAQLVKAYAGIGIDIKDKFQLENYLRHLVLEYVNGDRQISAAKKTVKARTNSGYMKKRESGSDKDFVVDILTADTEVLTSMITDMQTSEVLGVIMHDKKLNIKDTLKATAKSQNQDSLEALFEAERESGLHMADKLDKKGNKIGEEAVSPSELDYKSFSKRIAIGMDNLSKLAKNDELWIGENGEYKDVVDSLMNRDQDMDDENGGADHMFKYFSALLSSGEEGASAAGMIFKAVQERKAWVRAMINFKTWSDIIPEGFSKFEPAMSSKFYPVQEIDVNRLAKDLSAGILTDVASVDDLQPYLETAFKKAEAANVMVIPDELGATLIDLSDTHERSSAYRAIKTVNNFMKKNLLFAAPKFLQYEFRNFSSDVEKMFQNKPAAFKYLMKSANELYRFVFKDHVAPNDNVKDFSMMGGMQTLYGVAELGDLHKLKEFTRFYEKNTNIAQRMWDGYWNTTRRIDTFRETTVRFALYLAYLDELNANRGRPKDFGSSVPEEVMALDSNKKKSFLLANDALIDYSKTSHLGRRLRDTAAPFWSFTEGNTRSTYQWMKNMIHDNRVASSVGRKLLGKVAVKTPYYAIKVGKAYLAWSMLTLLLAAWNHGLHDDEEEELPEDIRNQLHIIWGRDEKGNIAYTSGLGAAEDFLKWVGLDDIYSQMMDLYSGKRTFQEVATDIVQQPVNKLVGLVNPIAKSGAEGLLGVSTYPNVFETSSSQDGFDDKMISMLGVGNEYKALKKEFKGVPARNFDPKSWVTTLKDPGESAYYEVKDLVRDYKKRIGSPAFSGGGEPGPKSEALYQYKQALKFGDEEAADRYLMKYAELGGTVQGVNQSLKALDPLSALSDSEMGGFMDSLTPADQKRFDKAMEFFTDTLLGSNPMK